MCKEEAERFRRSQLAKYNREVRRKRRVAEGVLAELREIPYYSLYMQDGIIVEPEPEQIAQTLWTPPQKENEITSWFGGDRRSEIVYQVPFTYSASVSEFQFYSDYSRGKFAALNDQYTQIWRDAALFAPETEAALEPPAETPDSVERKVELECV